jgi:hypothetical protein
MGVAKWRQSICDGVKKKAILRRRVSIEQKKEEEFNRLPWLGQGGRTAAGCAWIAAALRC